MPDREPHVRRRVQAGLVRDVVGDRVAQAAGAQRLATHLCQHRNPQDAVGVLVKCEFVENRNRVVESGQEGMLDQPRAVVGKQREDGLGVLLQVHAHEDLHSRTNMNFTSAYVERILLRDGTPVLLRLLVPEDRDLLRRGFERLSPQSRYARFLAPKQRLTDEELSYLCDIDQRTHFALGAIREDGDGRGNPVGLGIARFIQLKDDPTAADAAIAVADEIQHQGLGRVLFERLCAAAAERGIERFRCDVLGTNTSMQQLLRTVAPVRAVDVESGVMSIEFALPDENMYRFFREVAADTVKVWRK